MYSTAYLSTADWNDTRFKNADFDKKVLQLRGELDIEKRKAGYRDLAMTMRDEGGLIVPFFNDYIDALSDKVMGYKGHAEAELADGYALAECWLAA